MKILFAWTGVTSYMADCWRHLQSVDGVELRVVVETVDSGKEFAADETLAGLDVVVVGNGGKSRRWEEVLRDGWRPDVLFAGGWRSRTTRRIMAALAGVPKVFCLDMPWRWRLRCIAARFVLRRFMRSFAAIFVPGLASARYARWLGFRPGQIFTRLYAVDQKRFRNAVYGTGRDGRRGFLYVGRYSPEKRVDLVEAAYRRYMALGGSWSLDCYGQGGKFVQAGDMPAVYAAHACLLLASSFDPWPLVMLEAKSAGLDVIASSRCGNCAELGAYEVRYGDVEAMARAMLEVEGKWRRGEGGAPVADLSAYDCEAWAMRVLDICSKARRGRFYCPGMDEPANGMAVVAELLAGDARYEKEYIVHGAWLPSGWLRCLWALLRGSGYIRMAHGAYSPVYLAGKGRWKKLLAGPVERFFLRRAKRLIATCAAESGWIKDYLGENRPEIEIADLTRFFSLDGVRREPLPSGRPLHVLYLGRRHPLKGVGYLEDAVNGLDGIELKIVSDARGDEKDRVWKWCDVLVLPTLSENFGLVVAEALARGKRVITTDGVPAWRGRKDVVYLEGFCGGTDETRISLLREAISNISRDTAE